MRVCLCMCVSCRALLCRALLCRAVPSEHVCAHANVWTRLLVIIAAATRTRARKHAHTHRATPRRATPQMHAHAHTQTCETGIRPTDGCAVSDQCPRQQAQLSLQESLRPTPKTTPFHWKLMCVGWPPSFALARKGDHPCMPDTQQTPTEEKSTPTKSDTFF